MDQRIRYGEKPGMAGIPRIDPPRTQPERTTPSAYTTGDAAAREQLLLDILPAMLFASSPTGTWDYVNPPFCAYTGCPPEALTGMGWVAALHEEDRDASLSRWNTAISSGTPLQVAHRLRSADGSHRWFSTQCVPQHDSAGTIARWVGIAMPIASTSQATVEHALHQVATLARAERDYTLATVAHELRAPLTVLLGQSQLLQQRLASRAHADPSDQRAANILVEQARRLTRLTNALMDVALLDQGQVPLVATVIDLAALAKRVVQTLQPTLPSHPLRLISAAVPLWVAGDPIRLEQVLQNLLQNAVKYSPAGSEIVIMTAPQGRQAQLSVRDQGIGVAASAQPRLFQRFFRASSDTAPFTTGLGLGLYICKSIMDMHGGSIAVESAIGQGSTFVIHLPLAEHGPIDRRAVSSWT